MMILQLYIDRYPRLSHIFFSMGNPYTLTSFRPISSSATVQRNLKEKLHKENTSHETTTKEECIQYQSYDMTAVRGLGDS
jgi:hypothetical protein